MANSKIFCSAGWYDLHIYWDGALGICCQESRRLTTDPKFNIANTSIQEWFNSEPARNFRMQLLGDAPLDLCSRCYIDEQRGGQSRRYNCNQKSVIYNQSFNASFEQSPGRKHFNISGLTTTHPVDLHIDLGNFCNLACKMCNAKASSKIASQEVKWGKVESQSLIGTDWTRNQKVWNSFKQQLLDLTNLANIHFMGGETLLSSKFEDLIDFMIAHKKFNVGLSFVTNGTIYNLDLLKKLAKFRRVGIEFSLETVDAHNAYQRQGTVLDLALHNLKKYQAFSNRTSITVTLRPAVSVLSIGYYHTLLRYALAEKLLIKGQLVNEPKFLDPIILPKDIKTQYLAEYLALREALPSIPLDYNASDPNLYISTIAHSTNLVINTLSAAQPADSDAQLEKLVEHCRRWDSVYSLDARALYPEFSKILDQYGY